MSGREMRIRTLEATAGFEPATGGIYQYRPIYPCCVPRFRSAARFGMFGRITLAIIKPDVCAFPPKLTRIKELIAENGFKVLAEHQRRYTLTEMESFYKEHAGKFFYNRLTTYMSSGPIIVWILHRGEKTITEWRTLLGPTKVFKAVFEAPDSLRGRFGLTDTRNAGHGSDSPESVRREVQFFFPNLTEERLQTLLSDIPTST